MARVTVEDCIVAVPSRFELVALASQRAKDIASGAPLTLDRDNDKDPVVSLREVAKNTVKVDTLREECVLSFQKRGRQEEPELEGTDLLTEIDAQEIAADMKATAFDENELEGELEGDVSFAEDNIETED